MASSSVKWILIPDEPKICPFSFFDDRRYCLAIAFVTVLRSCIVSLISTLQSLA